MSSPEDNLYNLEVLRRERDAAITALGEAAAVTASALHSANKLWDKYTALHEQGVSQIALVLS